jgi:high-affinity iron transporter
MRRLLPYLHPHSRAWTPVVVVLVTATLVAGSGGAASAASVPTSPDGTASTSSGKIVVTDHSCAVGWTAGKAGRRLFRVEDRSPSRDATVYLYNPYLGVTVATATVRAGAVTTVSVRLKAGRYKWSCRLKGRPALTSVLGTVRLAPILGGPAGPIYLMPVMAKQMAPAIASYRAYVTAKLALEAGQVAQLQTAIAGGQLTAARSAWLVAHLTWHRIGGAYDAFGDLGTSIDGTADRLQDGVTSAQFTGFHKVELDLWQANNLSAAATDTSTLLSDVMALAQKFPHEAIAATELPLRTHEILEDGLRDELSGSDDYGSGTDMASVEADVDGTRELLMLLAPVLRPRAPDLEATAAADLNKLDTALAATEVNGQWVAVPQVPLAQRQQVDADIGATLETLDLAPELLQVVGATT